jgi:hypothetical protein
VNFRTKTSLVALLCSSIHLSHPILTHISRIHGSQIISTIPPPLLCSFFRCYFFLHSPRLRLCCEKLTCHLTRKYLCQSSDNALQAAWLLPFVCHPSMQVQCQHFCFVCLLVADLIVLLNSRCALAIAECSQVHCQCFLIDSLLALSQLSFARSLMLPSSLSLSLTLVFFLFLFLQISVQRTD